MNILTIIPARSGSKSLKDKNIRQLNGMPLIYYSIRYSLNCEMVTDTLVSTDSVKYSKIALSLGAQCPFLRPNILSGDLVQDYEVIKHGLFEMEKIKKIQYDFIVLLRPTSPLRPDGLIEEAMNILNNSKSATSVRSMVVSSQHPYRSWKLNEDNSISSFFELYEPYNLPRQELPLSLFQTGEIEVIRRSTIIDGSVSGKKVLPLIVKNQDYIDIDDIEDFKNASKIFNE